MNYLLRKTFENRGYTDSFLSSIDDSSHDRLKDVDFLISRLKQIHDSGFRIVILPDFDMDGICSGVTGFAGLAELGFNVGLYIPDPNDGYGFNEYVIDKIISMYPDVKAIISCDTGTSCTAGINYAVSKGIEMLITDHHKQKFVVQNATCIVNPMRMDETYAHPSICGAYVFYQVLEAYAESYTDRDMLEQIKRLRVFAGIGTVSDMMPVLYENRQLLRDAINICRLLFSDNDSSILQYIHGCDIYRRAFWGLFYVFSGFATMGDIESTSDIDEEFFGYYFAPMFNSVKRMDGDMSMAFGMFFGNTPLDNFDYLYQLNEKRKTEVKMFLKELGEINQPYAPYVYFSTARPGILGLLAQDVMKVSGVPSIVVSARDNGRFAGSGRSPVWYPFLDLTENVFLQGDDTFFAAGHNPAFGVGFSDEHYIQMLYDFLSKDVVTVFSSLDVTEAVPDFVISTLGDGDIGLDIVMFAEYLSELHGRRPFGVGFEKPRITLKFKVNEGAWKVIGQMKEHLKISLPMGFDVLVWNRADAMPDDLKSDSVVELSGYLSMNYFRGVHSVSFVGNFTNDDFVGEGIDG